MENIEGKKRKKLLKEGKSIERKEERKWREIKAGGEIRGDLEEGKGMHRREGRKERLPWKRRVGGR